MRLTALGIALLLCSSLASAQDRAPVERRVDTIEKQIRSIQRRVFAPGSAPIPTSDPAPVSAPANTGAVVDLTARVDALERQLTSITGLVEENTNRIRRLEERVTQQDARRDAAPAPSQVPSQAQAPTPVPAPTQAEPAPSAPPELDAPSGDPAENAYLAGFRLWEGKRYDEAETVLKDVVAKHPKHRRASWARNLLGRTYLDTNKPATAAETFLANYQDLPTGDRAPDSLYFLGAALMKLNKPQQACKVYDELADVYASTMRDFIKTSLPPARKQAKCTS